MIDIELLKRIKAIEISSRKLVNEVLSGEYHSVFKGLGINFSEVREYQIGDDARFIDWNVTARAGKPFIKVYEEERELNVVIILDVSASTFFSTALKTKNEIAAEISAILAFSALANNDKTGIIMFSDKLEKFIPPQRSRKNALRIIREILAYQPTGKTTNLEFALEFAVKKFKKKSVIFIISDFYAYNFEKPLTYLTKKNDVTAITISDDFEFNLKSAGLINFVDSEQNIYIEKDTADIEFLKDYQTSNNQRINDLKQMFNKLDIDFLNIKSSEDYIAPLIKYFKKRVKKLNR